MQMPFIHFKKKPLPHLLWVTVFLCLIFVCYLMCVTCVLRGKIKGFR